MIDRNPLPQTSHSPRQILRRISVSETLCAGFRFCFLLLSAIFGATDAAKAQSQAAPEAVAAPTADETPAASPKKPLSQEPLESLRPASRWLPNAEGTLVEVPWDAKLEDFLKFLRMGQVKPAVKLPPAVTNLSLTGTADDVRAVLTAEFVIQNEIDGDYVLLPLALHEAVLREDVDYDGPGSLYPKEPDRTLGQSWWLKGKGKHRLTLKLSVPVKKQGVNRRLQLTLPFATQSELQLTAGDQRVVVKDAEGDVEVINLPEQPSRIKKIGLGSRLDLTWQPVVAESPLPPVLEVDTDIQAHAAQAELLVEAQQRINVVQGSVSEVVVHLPTAAKFINVAGSRDYRSHQASSDDARKIVVQLNGMIAGPFQLTWTVRLPANQQEKFELDGFRVEQARRQDGRIGLIPIEGLRMTVANADHPHLSQINAADFRSPSGKASRAYRFFNQPFRLVLGVETVEPSFTVEPRVTLDVSAEELTLEGNFSIQILRGDLQAVEIDWPNWKADGWVLDERPEELKDAGAPVSDGAAGRLRLRLSGDHPDRLAVKIKARRAIRPGENIPVSLPHIASPDGAQTSLTITDAANVSSDVTPIGETVLNVLLPEVADVFPENVSAAARRERGYRVLTGEQVFSLRVARLEQRVDVTSLLHLALSGARVRGVQNFQFDVHHERLAFVRIAVPEAWRTRPLQFQIAPDRGLPVEWSPGLAAGTMIAKLALPEPRLGKFTLQALWEQPLSGEVLGGETGVKIPVFQAVDHAVRQTDLQVDAEDAATLTVNDAAWKPRTEMSGGMRWTADAPVDGVTVQLDNDGGGTQPFLITGADLRARFDRQGAAHCEATYRLTGWMARLGLVLPVDAGPPQVAWNGRTLSAPAEVTAENKPRHYQLRVRSDDGERKDHVLTVRYTLSPSQSFGVWNRWSIEAPQLIHGQWMAEGKWLLHIPGDQHLFGFSSQATPRFSWRRTGVFWSRISAADDQAAQGTLTGSAAGNPGGNFYAFSQYGEIREFRYSTMSAPMVLFVGASVSLAVVFLVLNISWLRHLLTIWGVVFLMALSGLWFRPQLEVLLQPILIGFLFPMLALWIQNLRRRDVPPVLSFDPLMDLVESRSSVNSRVQYPVNDLRQEPILQRSPSGSTHDFLQAEARSGVP